MKVMNDVKVDIDREQVYRFIGHKKGVKMSARLARHIDESIERAKRLIRPKVVFTTRKVKKTDNGSLMIDGNVTLKSSRLSRTLGKCDDVTVFLITIGKEIEKLISKSMKEKKMSDAYIYDAIGSATVEAVADKFQHVMDEMVKEDNDRTTLRFSPGYCDWNIREQEKVFEILDSGTIDVKLNDNCLMSPRKSVSGVFGIGDSRVITKSSSNPCRLCNMRNRCSMRRN